MTAKQRILALKLLEKQKHHPGFAKKLGVEVKIKNSKTVEVCPKGQLIIET